MCDIMSSQPAVGNKPRRSAPNGTDTSDNEAIKTDTDRGEEEGSSGPKLERAEMRNKKLKRHGEANNMSRDHKGEGHRMSTSSI